MTNVNQISIYISTSNDTRYFTFKRTLVNPDCL